MEIDGKYLFYGVIVFVIVLYMFYYVACKNAVLNEKLLKYECDNNSMKDSMEDKVKKIAKKGVKAYASSNNLEEVPKFL